MVENRKKIAKNTFETKKKYTQMEYLYVRKREKFVKEEQMFHVCRENKERNSLFS